MPTAERRQEHALRLANATRRAAGQAVHAWWRDLIDLLNDATQLGPFWLRRRVQDHCRALPAVARGSLGDSLTRLYDWGFRSARRGVLARVPRDTLWRLAARRPVPVTEERYSPISAIDLLFSQPLTRFPALPQDIPAAELGKLALPVPPEHVIRRRMDRLIAPFLAAPRPDLIPPERLADIVVQSYSQGKSVQEIAKDLLPHVDGVRASAERVGRTWGMHVANESQFDAHEQLGGDVVVGYTIRSAKLPSSRDEHVRRDGTEYYRSPEPGQLGFDQMPRPPHEADGTLAWNCQCFLEPILAGTPA